jgi:hypothetical protein
MNKFFQEGTFLLFPFGIILIFMGFHENDGFWTPIFTLWGCGCFAAGLIAISDSISWKKEKIKRDYRESFIKDAKNLDQGKYEYQKRFTPLPIELREKVLEKTSGMCFYCGLDLNVNNIWEMDHLYPHRRGGVDSIVNLFPACLNCNERKWSKNPMDFILELWTCDENITKFLRGFLIQHRDKSLAYLTNEPYGKGECDYWYATKQRELFELIITNTNLKTLSANKKEEVLKLAQELVLDLFVRHTGRSDYRKKYDLKERIEFYKINKEFEEQYTNKKWDKFFRDNPEPQ